MINGDVLCMVKIEITSWLVSVYDFYSRVVKDPSQRVSNKNRTNEPTMK